MKLPLKQKVSVQTVSCTVLQVWGDFVGFGGTTVWPLLSWARAAFAVHLRNLQDFKSQQLLDLRSCRKGMDRNDKIPAAAWKEVIFWGIKNKEVSFGSF